MAVPVEVHELVWDEATIQRFWDFFSARSSLREDYFSYQLGTGIIALLKSLTSLEGRLLDYGCGPGYLIDHLLAAGLPCEGVDLSPASVDIVNHRLEGHPLWRGAQALNAGLLPAADGSLDVVLFVETVEHLLPHTLDATLRELHRILKPGSGRLYITTPHDEQLDRSEVICPGCGSLFHRYQHLSSFTRASLTALLESHGFTTMACEATELSRFQSPGFIHPLGWSPRYFLKLLLHGLARLDDLLSLPGRPFTRFRYHWLVGSGPHLFYLGQKK